jgi:hypothetical protein
MSYFVRKLISDELSEKRLLYALQALHKIVVSSVNWMPVSHPFETVSLHAL